MALLGGPMKASDLFVRCGLALCVPGTQPYPTNLLHGSS